MTDKYLTSMQKTINGKKYNTETATALGFCESGDSRGDFNHYEEVLFITKNKNAFLYKSGGALSSMAVSCGNNGTTGSSTITTDFSPSQWIEENLQGDEMIAAQEQLSLNVIDA